MLTSIMNIKYRHAATIILGIALLPTSYTALSTEQEEKEPWQLAEKTEVWEPAPPKVTTKIGSAPSDATLLLSRKNLLAWESTNGGDAKWSLENGVLTVGAGLSDIRTKQSFCDAQFHVEWQSPAVTTNAEGKNLEGQQRGNSGFFIQERYEVQILDSHGGKTYANGQAGSIYKQHVPLANATLGPKEWNIYDIIYSAPRFTAEGDLNTPAHITVLHNGVLVQNHTEILGATTWIGKPAYETHGCAPLRLQDHGNPVRYRNIWVREL